MSFIYLDFVSLDDDGIQDAFEDILAAIRAINAKRIVLDSFSALSMSFRDRIESRITVQVFLGKIMRAEGITTLIISEIPYGRNDLGNGIEESVADAVIKLEHGPDNASPIFLKVLKMRGTAINREKHICSITSQGLILYPKQRIEMNFPTSEKRVSSGIVNLDEQIDGNGLIEGTISAIIGASASGKSTFAFQFITAGLRKHNESGIFCSLEDSEEEIKRMSNGFDYRMEELEFDRDGLKNEKEKGASLSVITYNHTEYNPDAFIASLEEEIKAKKPKRLAIDGLSIYELKYRDQLHEITERISSLVRKYKITSLITLLGSEKHISGY